MIKPSIISLIFPAPVRRGGAADYRSGTDERSTEACRRHDGPRNEEQWRHGEEPAYTAEEASRQQHRAERQVRRHDDLRLLRAERGHGGGRGVWIGLSLSVIVYALMLVIRFHILTRRGYMPDVPGAAH